MDNGSQKRKKYVTILMITAMEKSMKVFPNVLKKSAKRGKHNYVTITYLVVFENILLIKILFPSRIDLSAKEFVDRALASVPTELGENVSTK